MNYVPEISALLAVLKTATERGGVGLLDKAGLRKAAHQLSELAKQDELIDGIVSEGAIPIVCPLLNLSALGAQPCTEYEEVEKEASFILGLLAVKPEYQTKIAEQNALAGLVRLLNQYNVKAPKDSQPSRAGSARRAADAITNLAHENVEIKNMVRAQNGIPPLVVLLEALDIKVQRAAAGALRTLAFKNEGNKEQIVECKALPILIQMLCSEDQGVHYEAVGVLGNLVHSSQHIKRKVLEEGALQPVVGLLNSPCSESQREAALLLGQFATTDSDTKAKIVQRGAVPLLISMLSSADSSLKEMSTFALGRLAQNNDNQAGIVQCGGLLPLLELLESKAYSLQHNAAFALYGLADNEDNVPDIIKVGALQRLVDCGEKLSVQASKDCVQKTITRMEQKLSTSTRVLNHVEYMLRSGDILVQQRAAMSLAKLAPTEALHRIFAVRQGLDVLLNILTDRDEFRSMQLKAANSVLELARKVDAITPIDCLPAHPEKTVRLGSQYVNNPSLADISFVVDGKPFYAHRIALVASSDAFRVMFDGGYREKEASSIEIPNIGWDVFHCMMTYIYTGNVDVAPEIAPQLLQASDQYLLEGLKRLCEMRIAQALHITNLSHTFDLSESYSAPQLAKRCVLFTLEHFQEASDVYDSVGFSNMLVRMVPYLRVGLLEDMNKVWSSLASSGPSN
mmetsp:Transcript_28271/g.76355  ORF Transcript_28271/g.76355 Transcript_28271/m.76355 type:complete len:682 (-) Transcript_28271:731-2776(-)